MPRFASGTPRLAVLLAAIAAFCLLPAETLARGGDLCLWRNLFHLSACPACGSTRALAALFHGRFAEALSFNRNVLLTAPAILALALRDARLLLKKV